MNSRTCRLIAICLMLCPIFVNADTGTLRSPIGTNLDFLSYWSSQLPFVDVMKTASPWISADSEKRDSQWDDQRALDLDENGWIRKLAHGQIARSLMLREIGGRYPAGRYVVRYKGRGTLKFLFDAQEVSRKQGEIVLNVTPGNAGICALLEATDPADPVREIEITPPGGICDDDPFTAVKSGAQCKGRRFLSFADNSRSILFNPLFLDRLRAYSVLRFVDWMQTNNSVVTTWSQRTPVSYQSWGAARGVPLEIMIELANRMDAHPWINIPHQTDDTYAQEFAQMMKAKLKPGLRVYVEHSNEVWNGIFPQHAWVVNKAAAQSPRLDNMQYHALRSRALGEIFKSALGADRVVTVLAAQAGYAATATKGLSYLKSRFGKAIGIDAVAIAPYLIVTPDPAAAPKFVSMPMDALFDYVRSSALPTSLGWVKTYRGIANDYGVRLISYEGGQHLVGINGAQHNPELNARLYEFNRDPRIKDLYLDYLAGWKQAGGELFMHYTDVGKQSMWGSFGALEYVAQPRAAAPKFDALQTFIEKNPVWWTR